MQTLPLQNKTIIITGGAGLIGNIFVRACAEAGANVIVADIDSVKGKALALDIRKKTNSKNIIFQRVDITDKKSIENLISVTLKRFGKIDGLVNNAYPKNKAYGQKFEDVSYESFSENMSMHVGGYFLMTQCVSKIMMKQKSGAIVFMGSIYGFKAPRFEIYKGTSKTMPVEYSAIKGAILNLSRYLASYLGPYNIRVNAISPGGILDGQHKNFVKQYGVHVKLGGRMGDPSDITGALIFLLSSASEYVTGQNVVVDGGWCV